LVVVVLVTTALTACSSSSKSTASMSASSATTTAISDGPQQHAVGLTKMTFVDRSRPTPANGTAAAKPGRVLATTLLYPAAGDASSATPRSGAAPDRTRAPYPLVVFAHGLGANPDLYVPLLRQWAAAGFVVAAPRFPLTDDKTPGGPNAGDVINQPADMSFVLTSVLDAS
jgi:predicted dienelactone hydrolase